ncbi:MAG: HAD family hydrolase [Acetobacteraceae bacterium]|nr:HAD family hydrolase [Acetobacteraceae bacterium]
MTRTLILDLDGTLVDSVPDLASALNRLMVARGLAPFDHPATAAMVGDGARALVERAFTRRGLVADESAQASFLVDYSANAAVATCPFPGTEAALRDLAGQGWRLAVCTNKPEIPARVLLRALGLEQFFAAIGAGDSFAMKKPDPRHLLSTIALAGGDPARAVMVGDHANDVAAAIGAGLPCVFAAWGYGPPAMAAGATVIVEGFAALPNIVNHLLPAA